MGGGVKRPNKFSKALKRMREAEGLSQVGLAKLTKGEITNSQISTWESGTCRPSRPSVLTLCGIFGCEEDDLAGKRFKYSSEGRAKGGKSNQGKPFTGRHSKTGKYGSARMKALGASDFAKNLREFREANNLSRGELAKETGGLTTGNQIYHWERGTCRPQKIQVEKLAEFFECKVADLIDPDDPDVFADPRRVAAVQVRHHGSATVVPDTWDAPEGETHADVPEMLETIAEEIREEDKKEPVTLTLQDETTEIPGGELRIVKEITVEVLGR